MRLDIAVEPADTETGFTVKTGKGQLEGGVAERDTDPAKLFWLVTDTVEFALVPGRTLTADRLAETV